MTSHRPAAASAPTDRRVRASESFVINAGFLLSWDADLDAHAKNFAELLQARQLSPPMSTAAMRGVAELLATDCHMNHGQSAEAAVARSTVWRRLVVDHIWGRIAAAEHLPKNQDCVDQVTNGE
jgi:hypothetical protein